MPKGEKTNNDVQWTAQHDNQYEAGNSTQKPPHPLQALASELRLAAEQGVEARLRAIDEARHRTRAQRHETDTMLVHLWHDHRSDPGVKELIDRLVDGVVEKWDSYSIDYLAQVYARDRPLPFALEEDDVRRHFGIASDRAEGLTDQHWDEYRESAMAEWMTAPDYDLVSGIQAVTVIGTYSH